MFRRDRRWKNSPIRTETYSEFDEPRNKTEVLRKCTSTLMVSLRCERSALVRVRCESRIEMEKRSNSSTTRCDEEHRIRTRPASISALSSTVVNRPSWSWLLVRINWRAFSSSMIARDELLKLDKKVGILLLYLHRKNRSFY